MLSFSVIFMLKTEKKHFVRAMKYFMAQKTRNTQKYFFKYPAFFNRLYFVEFVLLNFCVFCVIRGPCFCFYDKSSD